MMNRRSAEHVAGSRPSICFVAPNAYPVLAGADDIQWIGGAEVQQVIVARGLAARGYRVSMICLDFGQSVVVEVDGIKVLRAFRRNAGLPIVRFISPRLTSLWKCMRLADADIYYQRGAAMLTGLVSAFARHHRRKSIFAVAGAPKIQLARDRWLYEYGVRRVDRVFVQHDEQAAFVRTAYGREPYLVPNCYQRPEESTCGRDRILWVSTIRRLKRPELMFELARAMPEFRITIVGGPSGEDPRYYKSIERQAQGLRNVEFVGFVPYSRVDRFFDEAAIFVNTSETEGFPNTFLQAWSRGIPTVSFVDCGARINGAQVGWVVDSQAAMHETIKRLMNDEALRSEAGSRCRAYFDANHTPDHVLDLYEEYLCELAGSGPTNGASQRSRSFNA
jgi:glycosyltransferase involved in cell wall biosynthesis